MKLGFLSALTLIFVVAKLFGVITWSWWLVFLPAIISFVIGFILIALVVVAKVWADEK